MLGGRKKKNPLQIDLLENYFEEECPGEDPGSLGSAV